MPEEFCRVGDMDLCYETFGDASDPTLLLVMGLATQMIAWRTEFCERLVAEGFRVVRFDNRDVGRSGRVDAPGPTIPQLLSRSPRAGAYRVSDMAADAVGLLDHLDVGSAHVAGVSMGGMIAQTMAARHPDRVRSLASIMSTTGHRFKGQPQLGAYPVLLRRAPTERAAYVAHVQRVYATIGSPGFDREEADIAALANASFDRGIDPRGTARQLGAVVASGDRTSEIRQISCPTVVIHGTRDRLIGSSGGRATARAIAGSRLVMIDGMGHDLPSGVWPQVIEAIVANARSADAARASEPAAA